jgi:hypothetical protein
LASRRRREILGSVSDESAGGLAATELPRGSPPEGVAAARGLAAGGGSATAGLLKDVPQTGDDVPQTGNDVINFYAAAATAGSKTKRANAAAKAAAATPPPAPKA